MTDRKKILIVDDTEATRYAVARVLTLEGYSTIEAANGRDALQLVRSENPDLVTLDIHLPDLSGFEVCRQIKRDPSTVHIPVLQVSASYVTAKDKVHGLEGGADGYLTHPFEPAVLTATVRALLRYRQLNDDLRSAEERLKRALEEAEMANQAKTRFLSNMSHEIRTPLGLIQGFADLALDPHVSSTVRKNYLLTIKRNAQNLTKLIGEILDLAKIEAGRINIEKNFFSLPDLIEEVVEVLSLTAREKGIALNLDYKGPFPGKVESDSTRVRQVLLNLITNALKFTERGGVTVTAISHKKDDSRIQIEIRVRDTGIGLNADQRARLFEAFVQADSSTTRRFGGTGLGLNLSKKLAHELGGDLTLEQSEPNQGSTFVVTFDAGLLSAEDFAARFRHSVKSETAYSSNLFANQLQGLRVLLAEDSIDNQELLSRYLTDAGAELDIANDGLEAITKSRANHYDVILMDVQMPNVDGYEANRTIREEGCGTPIIALTANALKEDRDRALRFGFDGYLTKPLSPEFLIKMVQQFKDRPIRK